MSNLNNIFFKAKKFLLAIAPAVLMMGVQFAFADKSIGDVASNVTGSMRGIAGLMTAGSLVAGLGFAISAILKFKQHKDNPTQIPVGTPIALVFIAAALLFLPSMFHTLGGTLFGSTGGSAGSLSGSTGWLKTT